MSRHRVAAGFLVAALALAALVLGARRGGPPAPAVLDTRNDACASCRMAVSDARFAAQLVAPAEEPRFFDDVGCLRDWLAANPGRPSGAVAYVADHRTKEWIPAARAVYTRRETLETPMASHVIAHESASSRDQDPAARGGSDLPAVRFFAPAGLPGSGP